MKRIPTNDGFTFGGCLWFCFKLAAATLAFCLIAPALLFYLDKLFQ